MRSGAWMLDTSMRIAPTKILLDRVLSQAGVLDRVLSYATWATYWSTGALWTRQRSTRDSASLHPCRQAASFLPCARPPDACGSFLARPRSRLDQGSRDRAEARAFAVTRSGTDSMPRREGEDEIAEDAAPAPAVTGADAGPGLRHFRRSLNVLSATAPSSSRLHAHPSCWFTHVGHAAGRPRTPGRIHSEDHIISHCFSHLRRVAYPEGTPPCLSTGNFYFLTLADIFSPDYFLPLCHRTPPYYWERTSSVCIMHLYSVYGPPPTLILPAYFYLSLYAHPYVLSLYQGYIFGGLSIWP